MLKNKFHLDVILSLIQAPGLQFDQGGLPVLPGSPEGCAVM